MSGGPRGDPGARRRMRTGSRRPRSAFCWPTTPWCAGLTRDYRGKDRPTNVLSFPMFEDALARGAGAAPAGAVPLGDIVLAFETVRAEAAAEAKPFPHHVSHLLIHGCLHLLGYDHQNGHRRRGHGGAGARRPGATRHSGPVRRRCHAAGGGRRRRIVSGEAMMKELPAGGREAHVSPLYGLLTRLRVLARRRNGEGHSLRETLEELIEEDEEEEGAGSRRIHGTGARAAAQRAELRRAPGLGRDGAALGHPRDRDRRRHRRGRRDHAQRRCTPDCRSIATTSTTSSA